MHNAKETLVKKILQRNASPFGATRIAVRWNSLTALALAVCCVTTGRFVDGGTLYLVEDTGNRIGTYDSTTGAAINADFLFTNRPQDIGFSADGAYFYVSRPGANQVERFTMDQSSQVQNFISQTGADELLVNPANGEIYVSTNVDGAVTGRYQADGSVLGFPFTDIGSGGGFAEGIAFGGGGLLVSRINPGSVALFNASTGALINANFLTASEGTLWQAAKIAVDAAGNIYVTDGATVDKFDSSGTLIAEDFISSTDAYSIAIDDAADVIFVGNTQYVSSFRLSTGASLNPTFILNNGGVFNGLSNIRLAPTPVPEPSTVAMVASAGLAGLIGVARRRRAKSAI